MDFVLLENIYQNEKQFEFLLEMEYRLLFF